MQSDGNVMLQALHPHHLDQKNKWPLKQIVAIEPLVAVAIRFLLPFLGGQKEEVVELIYSARSIPHSLSAPHS